MKSDSKAKLKEQTNYEHYRDIVDSSSPTLVQDIVRHKILLTQKSILEVHYVTTTKWDV